MQLLYVAFFALMVTTCGYAVLAGGRDGRIACTMLIMAASLTPLVTGGSRLPLLILDASLLIGLVWLALCSRHFWPLWLAGLHLITVAEGLATFMVPDPRYGVLHAVTGFWAIPMQLVMALGIYLDRKAARDAINCNQGRTTAIIGP